MKALYDIEFYMEAPLDRWSKVVSFSCMQKSFAMGAWAMLKAHYGQTRKHRLLKDGVVIDEWALNRVSVGRIETSEKGDL